MRKFLPIIIFALLSIPTFGMMLRFGIFSMQDFHLFRLIEFDKCVRALQIPCRWAPDSGAGYGEPIFNFYGQLPYAVGEIFHILAFSKVDSLKIVFILSLILSAIGMFILANKIWKSNQAAFVSSILYLYAPYRAVDVWVRGALPEAVSFVFFPLILLSMENYLEKKKRRDLLFFSLFVALLVINHNLSVILFAPFLIVWLIYRFMQIRKLKPFVYLGLGGVFSFLLSAFYVLPVVFESKFIDINATTVGYFDWRAHFVTLNELFISRFWGYGGSNWGPVDGLSLSVGQMQWIVPVVCFAIIIFTFLKRRKISRNDLEFLLLFLIGGFYLFLTHNQSTFIWNHLSFMKYLQFPWRFLGGATFALALAGGRIVADLKVRGKLIVSLVVIVGAIALNAGFFRPDIWYNQGDTYFESGARWDEARFASIHDYWPNFGHQIPDKISDGTYINYFPGWDKLPDKNGLIVSNGARFKNTQVRTVGDLLSLGALILWIIFFLPFLQNLSVFRRKY